MKKNYSSIKKNIALALAGVILFSVSLAAWPNPAKAQTDPAADASLVSILGVAGGDFFNNAATAFNTAEKNVSDGVKTAYDTASDVIKNAAATAFNTALAGVLNTIAADSAKAIASGDWGAPVFSFDKGFFSSLADAAVGDFVAGFFKGTLGVDICNYNPELTLKFAIPLFRDPNKYKPACSLSQIVAHAKSIDLSKIVKIQLSGTTVKSLGELFDNINSAATFNATALKAQQLKILLKYRYPASDPKASDFTKRLDKVQFQLQDILDKSAKNIPLTEADKLFISQQSVEVLTRIFTCETAKDLQDAGQAFYADEMANCTDTPTPVDFGWNDAYSYFAAMTGISYQNENYEESKARLNKLIQQADAFAKTPENKPPIDIGMARLGYFYKTCYDKLNQVLDAKILSTGDTPSATGGLLYKVGSKYNAVIPVNNQFVTYEQGAKLTPADFMACQIVFNTGKLLSAGSSPKYQPPSFAVTFPGVDTKKSNDVNVLGDWVYLFNPDFVRANGGVGEDLVNRLVTEGIYFQATGDPTGATRIAYLKQKISLAGAQLSGLQAVFSEQISQIVSVLDPKKFAALEANQLSQDEATKERNKNNTLQGTDMATGAILGEAANKAGATVADQEKTDTIANGGWKAPETAVTEQKTAPADYNRLEFAQAKQSAAPPKLCEYKPDRIFANASCIFIQVLWNESIRNGLKSLNNQLQKSKLGRALNLQVDSSLQPSNQNESFLAGYTRPADTKCAANDLNTFRAMVDVGAGLGSDKVNRFLKLGHLTPACKKEFDDNAKAKGLNPQSDAAVADFQKLVLGFDAFFKALFTKVARGPQNSPVDTPESSNARAPFRSPLADSTIGKINLTPNVDFQLLSDMSTCPNAPATPSLYNCTINTSVKDAISQGLTIKQAIDKNLLNPLSELGIDADGNVPDPSRGFSLSAAQKLRKARILPLGFELAARLKVACYQKEHFGFTNGVPVVGADNMANIAPHFPYRWIGDECDFGLGNEDKEKIFRDEVLGANLQKMIDGFSKTGSLSEVCGSFSVSDVNGVLTSNNMSAFCGLINPDWVMKLPTSQCPLLEYSDILQAPKSSSRLQVCTELQSEVAPGNYGYCVKERNIWNVTGTSCPAQYSTCSSYLFKDGSVESYNKDSLVGAGLCSEKNAGCTWLSTLKIGTLWQDTVTKTNSLDCSLAGGTWDGQKCSNSRIYLTGNVESCSPENNGCTTVTAFKQENNNLVRDGSFEYSTASVPPSFWKANVETQDATCANGVKGNSCEINYPANLSSICLSQGGTFKNDGTCSVFNSAIAGSCGYCQYSGTDTAADKSSQQFTANDCTAQGANYAWVSGTSSITCQNNALDCSVANSSCPLLVVGNSDALTVASEGTKALEVNLNNAILSANNNLIISYPLQMAPEGSSIVLAGDAFSVSFEVKSDSNTTINARAQLIKTLKGGRVDSRIIALPITSTYSRYSISLTALTDGTDLTFRILAPKTVAKIYLDKVKIEYNSAAQLLASAPLAGSYTSYESQNVKLAVKLAPDYLKCLGYGADNPSEEVLGYGTAGLCTGAQYYWDTTNTYGQGVNKCYRFAPDADSCKNFAKACRADEAGCQLYTPVNGEPSVPGVVGQDNYCPTQCNGYDSFKQQTTYFEPNASLAFDYFIPSTAAQCKVEDVGCDQFTNLSLQSAGTAPIENYSYLRQCITPNTGKGEKGYFTWQGSATGAPQLKTFTLMEDVATGAPKVVSNLGMCLETDLGVDLDCLKFFDNTGHSFTRKLSYTIEASASCQNLRKTVSDLTTCQSTNGEWDAANNYCIYHALPSQSLSCKAEVNGCRAYLGNTGSNVFNILFDNFEASSTSAGWSYSGSGVSSNPAISTESITTSGQSLFVTGNLPIVKTVAIAQNESYKISFWAKRSKQETTDLTVKFSSMTSGTNKEFTTAARVGSDWKFYQYGPVFIDSSFTNLAANQLVIANATDVYLDNITLTQLKSSTYVIKDSWKTPQSCDQTNLGLSLPQAQLGCQEYKNSANQSVYLKSFTRLCREGSVGCQLIFDTHNSTDSNSTSYNLDNASNLDDTYVPADALKAVVVNDNSQCKLEFAGCQEVGYPLDAAGTGDYLSDVYVINNPDKYKDAVKPILCKDEELGCKAVTDSKGNADYVKIQSNNTCDYLPDQSVKKLNQVTGANEQQTISGWFKTSQTDLGCTSTAETSEADCQRNGGTWNSQYSQCTSMVPDINFNDCKAFDADYKRALEDSCNTDFKGSWFDKSTASVSGACGCVRYPFDYYKATDYPEHNVAAARCQLQYDQCTEFLDYNPNYIANGSFETFNDLDQTPSNWSVVNAAAGTVNIASGDAQDGSNALRLTKKTWRDQPQAGAPLSLNNTPLYIYQRLARLEKGKSYDINFNFKSTLDDIGVPAGTDLRTIGCRMPEASVEVVPYYGQPIIDAITNKSENFYVNRQNVKSFDSNGRNKDAKVSFMIPQNGVTIPVDILGCERIGAFWQPLETKAGVTVAAHCLATNPNEPTLDYEVRIYGPQNGACVSTVSGQKKFFDANGNPYNKATCETSGWTWQGNCIDSSLLIDNFQVALSQEHLYYFVDDGTLSRGECTAQNWDQGCISFHNKLKNADEIIQVKPDRQCSEWMFCQNRDLSTGRCLDWTTCSEQDGTKCVRQGSTRDQLRYKFNDFGQLQNIDVNTYRKRLGISEEFKINRWRSGDYDGYTLPNYPPLEQIFDKVPGAPASVITKSEFVDNLEDTDKKLSSDKIGEICRGYKEQGSPFSPLLKKLVPGFEGVNAIIDYVLSYDNGKATSLPPTVNQNVDPNDRLILCNYLKYTINEKEFFVAKHIPAGKCSNRDGECNNDNDCFTAADGAGTCELFEPEFICTNLGVNFGKGCVGETEAGNASCNSKASTIPPISNTPSVTDGTCQATKDLNRQVINGNIGACLEYDQLLKVHGGLNRSDIIANPITEKDLNNVNGQSACLTYFPL